MFNLLAFDAARDQVARQFVYDDRDAAVAPESGPTPARAAPAHRRRPRPFAALVRQVNASLVRATWSPTR